MPPSTFERIRKYAYAAFSSSDPMDPWHSVGRKCFEQHKVHGVPEKKLASMGESARTRWGHIMAEDTLSTKAHPNQAATAAAAKKRKQPAN